MHAVPRLALPLLALLAASCVRADHNIPRFAQHAAPADTVTLYADANGHLYPRDWETGGITRDLVERKHSLLSARRRTDAAMRDLREERMRQLDAAAARLRGADRVFILVHGFNNDHRSAREGFDVVRQALPAAPGDRVVEFHWDGLVGPGLMDKAAIWFPAAGYSQLAGTQALRGLLDRLRGRTVYVVAHSRGASVALSALSEPAYSRKFARRTERIIRDAFRPPALADDPVGAIRLLLIAPAIGLPDFWGPGIKDADHDCANYRAFPTQLRRIHYSVNSGDRVLKKFLSPLSSRFNATNLGYTEHAGDQLKSCPAFASLLVPHRMTGDFHGLPAYARHGVVTEMLRAAGVTDARDVPPDVPAATS